ncbi:MAG: patatin-like phospholipase family protein [Peptostreptococcaceae bacterium]|nr:patatin-like phospholipase family protein [Peptostreptococcaceae bacterium]
MGKVGLVLSGGGSRGAYQIGVWQALRELGVKIDLVAGTSVGAINGAIICQGGFDIAVSLWKEVETSMVFDLKESNKPLKKSDFNIDIGGIPLDQLNQYAKEILKNGGADASGLKSLLANHLDERLIRESPVDFGLVTVEYPAMIPYYMRKKDIPQGQLVDYILASASCFPAIKTYDIGNRKFIDGAYSDNLPVNFALTMGAESIIAVDLEAIGVIQKSKLNNPDKLITISSSWDLGSILTFSKVNSSRIMRLGYLDTFKSFELYDGNYYTFARGEFTKKELSNADAAAKIFQLNPEIIYKKQIFEDDLKDEIIKYRLEMERDIIKKKDANRNLLVMLKNEILKTHQELNPKSITLGLADDIKNQVNSKSLFVARSTKKLLIHEIAAAEYIVKAGLI